jgi:hypothetical protein
LGAEGQHISVPVMPILRLHRDSDLFVHQGTGTLFEIGGRRFVVGASHVFDELIAGGGNLCYFIRGSGGAAVPLDGVLTGVRGGFDVAAYRLADQCADLLESRWFLSLANVSLEPLSSSTRYVVHGFPAMWSAPAGPEVWRASTFSCECTPYGGDLDVLKGYEPELHHVFVLDQSNLRFPDGTPGTVPDLHGISGCSLWSYVPPSADEKRTIARVVSVQTGVYDSKPGRLLVKGTSWKAVLKLLVQKFPDLAPTIASHINSMGYSGPIFY